MHHWWRVEGVYLGGEHQESVVNLIPQNMKRNSQAKPTLVPSQLLDVATGKIAGSVRLHTEEGQTPQERRLLAEFNHRIDRPQHFICGEQRRGMTLRDYFAAKAMTEANWECRDDECAEYCYKIADAMMEARKK